MVSLEDLKQTLEECFSEQELEDGEIGIDEKILEYGFQHHPIWSIYHRRVLEIIHKKIRIISLSDNARRKEYVERKVSEYSKYYGVTEWTKGFKDDIDRVILEEVFGVEDVEIPDAEEVKEDRALNFGEEDLESLFSEIWDEEHECTDEDDVVTGFGSPQMYERLEEYCFPDQDISGILNLLDLMTPSSLRDEVDSRRERLDARHQNYVNQLWRYRGLPDEEKEKVPYVSYTEADSWDATYVCEDLWGEINIKEAQSKYPDENV